MYEASDNSIEARVWRLERAVYGQPGSPAKTTSPQDGWGLNYTLERLEKRVQQMAGAPLTEPLERVTVSPLSGQRIVTRYMTPFTDPKVVSVEVDGVRFEPRDQYERALAKAQGEAAENKAAYYEMKRMHEEDHDRVVGLEMHNEGLRTERDGARAELARFEAECGVHRALQSEALQNPDIIKALIVEAAAPGTAQRLKDQETELASLREANHGLADSVRTLTRERDGARAEAERVRGYYEHESDVRLRLAKKADSQAAEIAALTDELEGVRDCCHRAEADRDRFRAHRDALHLDWLKASQAYESARAEIQGYAMQGLRSWWAHENRVGEKDETIAALRRELEVSREARRIVEGERETYKDLASECDFERRFRIAMQSALSFLGYERMPNDKEGFVVAHRSRQETIHIPNDKQQLVWRDNRPVMYHYSTVIDFGAPPLPGPPGPPPGGKSRDGVYPYPRIVPLRVNDPDDRGKP